MPAEILLWIALAVLGCFFAGASNPLLTFQPFTSPLAVCNDGSPAGLYFAAATSDQQNDVWIVQQQGGGWCWDAPSCKKRLEKGGSLVSSEGWASSLSAKAGSILAATGTDFEFANKAYLKYCTSDGYVGNATAYESEFRGHEVVLAMVDRLVQKGLGASGDSTLIYSGCSAGGRGVMHNLNRIAALTAGLGVKRLVGLIDSGLYLDIEPVR